MEHGDSDTFIFTAHKFTLIVNGIVPCSGDTLLRTVILVLGVWLLRLTTGSLIRSTVRVGRNLLMLPIDHGLSIWLYLDDQLVGEVHTAKLVLMMRG